MPYDYIEEYQKQDDETIWEFRDKDAQSKIDTSLTETDYANPLTLETLQAQVAKNTKIKLDPIQDLHGYSKPWVGGAGKNKLVMTISDVKAASVAGTWNGNVYTHNNVVYTVNTDNDGNIISVKVNGTASSSASASLRFSQRVNHPQTLPTGSYIISSGVITGSNDVFVVCGRTYNNNWQELARSSGSDATFSVTNSDSLGISIDVNAGKTISNLIFYPMIRLATETDATFAPYTNLCPITGHDQIDILGCGKNLTKPINDNADVNGIKYENQPDGKLKVNGTASAYSYSESNSFTLKSGSYIISKNKSDGNRTSLTIRYASDGTAIAEVLGTEDVSFTLTSDAEVKIRVAVPSGKVVDSILEPMVRLASDTDSTFEPYQSSNQLTLPLPSTVYGGVLDLESGVLSVTYKIQNLGALNWQKVNSGQSNESFRSDAINTYKYVDDNTTNYICENYECISNSQRYKNHALFMNNQKCVLIQNLDYLDVTTFKTSLNGVQLCYELETPFTLYISPEQLKLLKSQNTITTSQYTQVKVTYRNGVFATLEELSDTAQDIYDEISGDTTTVSGNPINFTTREKQKSKSTIIDLEPIQDLHGFTKPWVGGAGKNLLPLDVATIKSLNTDGTWSGNKYTLSNVEFTILVDSDDNVIGIKMNTLSTPASNVDLKLFGDFSTTTTYTSAGSYTISLSGDGPNLYAGYQSATLLQTNGTPTATCSDGLSWSVLRAPLNKSLSNVTIYPMIRLSSVTDATFEPYTNIASISGRSSVDIDGCGKNFIRTKLADAKLRNITGTWSNNIYTLNNITFNVETDVNDYITGITVNGINNTGSQLDFALMTYNATITNENSLPTGTYILSGTPSGINNIHIGIRLDSDNSYQDTGNGVTFNVDASKGQHLVFLVLAIKNGASLNNAIFKPMIRSVSNQNGLYEPYTPSTDLTISFGQTVYGGILDVEKGELVVDRGMVDLNDYTFEVFAGTTIVKTSSIPNVKYVPNNTVLGNGLSENYQMHTGSGMTSAIGCIAIDTNAVSVNAGVYPYQPTGKFVYELETPITINLTPNTINLLKGINNISTTGTTITVTFKNGSVAHLDDLPENIFTDLDKEKLASIDTLAVTLDLLTHTLVVTQDI